MSGSSKEQRTGRNNQNIKRSYVQLLDLQLPAEADVCLHVAVKYIHGLRRSYHIIIILGHMYIP